jgi:hypothetical protein
MQAIRGYLSQENLIAAKQTLQSIDFCQEHWEIKHFRLATRLEIETRENKFTPVWDIKLDTQRERLLIFCGGGELLSIRDRTSPPETLLDAFPDLPKTIENNAARDGRMLVDWSTNSVLLGMLDDSYLVQCDLTNGTSRKIDLRQPLSRPCCLQLCGTTI